MCLFHTLWHVMQRSGGLLFLPLAAHWGLYLFQPPLCFSPPSLLDQCGTPPPRSLSWHHHHWVGRRSTAVPQATGKWGYSGTVCSATCGPSTVLPLWWLAGEYRKPHPCKLFALYPSLFSFYNVLNESVRKASNVCAVLCAHLRHEVAGFIWLIDSKDCVSDVPNCHQRVNSASDVLLIFLCSITATLTLTPPHCWQTWTCTCSWSE